MIIFITGFAKKCLIPYKPTFGDNFKKGKVVDVNPSIKVITLESGEKVAYDDLVIATGTGGPFPAKLPLDTNKEKAEQRYEDYVKLVSALSNSTIIVCGYVAPRGSSYHCGSSLLLPKMSVGMMAASQSPHCISCNILMNCLKEIFG